MRWRVGTCAFFRSVRLSARWLWRGIEVGACDGPIVVTEGRARRHRASARGEQNA